MLSQYSLSATLRSKSQMQLLYKRLYQTLTNNNSSRKWNIQTSAALLQHTYSPSHHHYHTSRISSNLLGFSPMANIPPPPTGPSTPKGAKPKRGDFGTIDAETANKGGVWAQTSAKREKIVELKGELKDHEFSLDDAATAVQKLDLELADGFKVLARAKDEAWEDYVHAPVFQEFLSWLEGTEKQADGIVAEGDNDDSSIRLNRSALEAHLTDVIRKADKLAEESISAECLALVRDFMEPPKSPSPPSSTTTNNQETEKDKSSENTTQDTTSLKSNNEEEIEFGTTPAERDALKTAFQSTLQLYQALILKHAAEHLMASWDTITKITDGDVDRYAIQNMDPPEITSLNLTHVNGILRSYLHGTCHDSVAAWWTLLDHDQDGLLDENQMGEVVENTIRPFHKALPTLFMEAVESYPVTVPLPPSMDISSNDSNDTPETTTTTTTNTTTTTTTTTAKSESIVSSMGWRQKRTETKSKKNLLKIFSKTLDRHFKLEVETPHRLRCIYAWAEKEHQNNRIESVLLDTGAENMVSKGVLGKKRYVELQPKISFPEFLVEQRDHFKALDQVGQEIFSSFKEDLHVVQGKGRQNKEARNEVALFFILVSLVDVGINML